MRKRVFCALWMAAFAALAGFPTWNPAAPAPALFFLIISPAAAGAITGALVQAPAVGRHSNVVGSAVAGMICAVISLPLMILGFMLLSDLVTVGKVPDNFMGPFLGTFFISVLVMKKMWWSILPLGAVGGLTLQLAWERVDRRCSKGCRPSEGPTT